MTVAPTTPEGESTLDEPAYIAALEAALIEAQPIGTEALRALADQRAAAIMQALTAAAGEEALAAEILPSQAGEETGDMDSGVPRVVLELGVEASTQP